MRPCQNRRQKAKEYLDKAKAELNGDVAIELLSRDGDSDRKVAEFIQGQLQETLPGLTINVKTVPLNNAIELMRKGDYELSVGMGTRLSGSNDFLRKLS